MTHVSCHSIDLPLLCVLMMYPLLDHSAFCSGLTSSTGLATSIGLTSSCIPILGVPMGVGTLLNFVPLFATDAGIGTGLNIDPTGLEVGIDIDVSEPGWEGAGAGTLALEPGAPPPLPPVAPIGAPAAVDELLGGVG